MAEVHESGCRFQFNFAKVYWNSRLGMEHGRMVELFQPSEVIVDMFCGVGPFAVPAAKKGCIVHANDLNPQSFHYLQHNGKINKCGSNLHCYNMDARDFITTIVVGTPGTPPPHPQIHHILMNLPASAISFLDVFVGLFDPHIDPSLLPFVHCYGFSKSTDPEKDIVVQAEKVLGITLVSPEVHNVRNVSVGKSMMRLSFKLPAELLNEPSCLGLGGDEPARKRVRTK
eukprot:TRINITY_DN16498_c0_g1_i1.p1 TRINITY_DN16498_c0_g1~~TRINITY_DN16498_c0_g1_i1.p1  ORF type:complete len:257 (+),score=59.19 TRINITY_DN16498_c0_g1_i1:90-773(+)